MRTSRLPSAYWRDLVAPVGARFVQLERQHESNARALAHAGAEDLGEAVEVLREGGFVAGDGGDGRCGHELT